MVETGLAQVHLRGTRRAYELPARMLLAMGEYNALPEVTDPNYHGVIGDLRNFYGEVVARLTIHAPRD